MRKLLPVLAIGAALWGAGCSSSNSEPQGYKASDFSKRPPPPGYGPAGGGAAKPAVTPPTGGTR